MRVQKLLNIVVSFFVDVMYSIYEPLKLKWIRSNNRGSLSHCKNGPLISVYVPTYNRCDILLSRAVKSVLNQTYKNFEFIIIGDGCTDSTEEEIGKLKDDRIRFVNIQRKKRKFPNTVKNHWLAGPIIPANYALSMVRGEWVARIDDDERWTKEHLDKLLEYAIKNDCEFITGDIESIIDGVPVIDKGCKMYSDYFHTKHLQGSKIENPEIGGTSTILYRSYLKSFKYNKNCWRKSVNSANDIDLYVRFIKAGVKICHLNKTVTFQHPRPGEDTIGWGAYYRDRKNKIQHFN